MHQELSLLWLIVTPTVYSSYRFTQIVLFVQQSMGVLCEQFTLHTAGNSYKLRERFATMQEQGLPSLQEESAYH